MQNINYPSPIIPIVSFDKILDQIIPNTLVICDLDNTLFDYKSRCAIKTDKKIQACGLDLSCVESYIPIITDYTGFSMLCDVVKWSGSKIIFLTARPNEQSESTDLILKYYKLNKYNVLYAGSEPKGEYLITNLPQIYKYEKIIFIDDLDANLNSVTYSLKKQNIQIPIQVYKFLII
jgi:hypothetical protein